MEIRFAQAKDIPGILSLLRQVGEVHHQGRPDIFRDGAQKYGASQILSMLDSSGTPIFVAVEDDKVLGYGFCMFKQYKNDPVIADHSEIYIDDLCVDKNYRGQNIGRQLVTAAEREVVSLGGTAIVLHSQLHAKGFYEKCGYVAEGDIEYEQNHPHVFMKKLL